MLKPESELEEIISSSTRPKLNKSVDSVALTLLPSDVLGLDASAIPLDVEGFGNCLFNACSLYLVGNPTLANALRSATSDILLDQIEYFSKHNMVESAAKATLKSADDVFPHFLSRHAQDVWDSTKDRCRCIKAEAERLRNVGQYGSMKSILALAEVIRRPIYSIYPDVERWTRPIYHKLVIPQSMEYDDTVHIMWSTLGNQGRRRNPLVEVSSDELSVVGSVGTPGFQPNHFVLVTDKL